MRIISKPSKLKIFSLVLIMLSTSKIVIGSDTLKTLNNSEVKYTLLKTPALPLMGIVMFTKSKIYPDLDPYPNNSEIPVIVQMYKGLHVVGNVVGKEMEESNLLWKKLRENKPEFMILPYFQSTLSAELQVSLKIAEEDPLNMISMYNEGSIEIGLSTNTEKFKIIPANGKRGFGLKASTTTNNISKNITEYISIFRIGNELFKIIEVDKLTNEVTILRGYKNTKAETHPTGSMVLAPVYRGKKDSKEGIYGDASSYPDCSITEANKKLEYHLRLDSKQSTELLAIKGAALIQRGASGLWLDLTSPGIFIPCNAYGEKVIPWNFELGEEYNSTSYLIHQELKVSKLRDLIQQKTGIMPQIVANNNGAGKYFEKGGGGIKLVSSTTQKPVPINGVVLEAAFSFYQITEWQKIYIWKTNLATLIHGSQNKYPVWPWLKNVRYAYLPMTKNEESNRYQFFDYCSTLLGYEKDAGIVCPIPLHWVDNKGVRTLNLPEYLFYDLGDPIERVRFDELEKMLFTGKNTYIRKWSKAIVLVNPADVDDSFISVPKGYVDPTINKEVSQVSMPAHTGKILLKIE
ncbi:MAG: hypothetical protein WCG74_07245 [Sediminibacterium sp.]